jgi:hypothetical protein
MQHFPLKKLHLLSERADFKEQVPDPDTASKPVLYY